MNGDMDKEMATYIAHAETAPLALLKQLVDSLDPQTRYMASRLVYHLLQRTTPSHTLHIVAAAIATSKIVEAGIQIATRCIA